MQELLRDIYAAYSPEIYRYFYGFTRDTALSEDLTSEVFLEALKSLHTFRGDASIKTWLFSIARHRWCRYLRKKKMQPPAGPLDLELTDSTAVEQNADDRALLRRIQELLSEQPPRSQEIMDLRMRGFSYYEIGLKLKISENSARVIEFRTRAKIKQILKEEGFADE